MDFFFFLYWNISWNLSLASNKLYMEWGNTTKLCSSTSNRLQCTMEVKKKLKKRMSLYTLKKDSLPYVRCRCRWNLVLRNVIVPCPHCRMRFVCCYCCSWLSCYHPPATYDLENHHKVRWPCYSLTRMLHNSQGAFPTTSPRHLRRQSIQPCRR